MSVIQAGIVVPNVIACDKRAAFAQGSAATKQSILLLAAEENKFILAEERTFLRQVVV